MIRIKRADNEAELRGILALQARNLRADLDEVEAAEEGFLIARHHPAALQRMNESQPSIIALNNEEVVGYVLPATQAVRDEHPLMADLFNKIDLLHHRGEPLRGLDYIVVAQVCVAKGHRGEGLVQRMYERLREALQGRYRYAITDIAKANRRSLQAHLKTGFQVIHLIEYDQLQWDVLLWDWTGPTGRQTFPIPPPSANRNPTSFIAG